MFTLPPLPPAWDGWHPILVHFPIALLPAAAVLIAMALILRKQANTLNLAALVVMTMGMIGMVLAFSSGEAAEEFAPESPVIHALVEQHEHAAEDARLAFLLFTAAFGVYALAAWRLTKPAARPWITAAGVLYLLAYAAPNIMLMNAAHLGGKLVHVEGVRARLTATAGNAAHAAPSAGESGEREKHD